VPKGKGSKGKREAQVRAARARRGKRLPSLHFFSVPFLSNCAAAGPISRLHVSMKFFSSSAVKVLALLLICGSLYMTVRTILRVRESRDTYDRNMIRVPFSALNHASGRKELIVNHQTQSGKDVQSSIHGGAGNVGSSLSMASPSPFTAESDVREEEAAATTAATTTAAAAAAAAAAIAASAASSVLEKPPALSAGAGEQPPPTVVATRPVQRDEHALIDNADLLDHRANDHCWEHFDFGMLDAWDAKGHLFCSPTQDTALKLPGLKSLLNGQNTNGAADFRGRELLFALGALSSTPPTLKEQGNIHAVSLIGDVRQPLTVDPESVGFLVCRVTTDSHLPPPTAPHTICDGANIVMDLSKMYPATCPQHRPGYMCDGPPIYWHYQPGAIASHCRREGSGGFSLESFPRDHLRDIFGGFGELEDAAAVASAQTLPAPIVLLVTRERGEHANMFHATTDLINAFYM
jgi:hypothetical protein